jgi:segregation and condensation protein B
MPDPSELPPADLEEMLRLAEAMAFASPEPLTARALGHALPEGNDADAVLAALVARYAGRGVELVQVAGGWQFRTAPDLAARLRRVVQVPRRLPRVAMETLAIIAYHQPVTRPEIEEIRGAALSQQTLDQLLEGGLVQPRGRKETPGRPTMWGTTAGFLTQFGLNSLGDLPRRQELFVEAPSQPTHAPALPPEAGTLPEPEG